MDQWEEVSIYREKVLHTQERDCKTLLSCCYGLTTDILPVIDNWWNSWWLGEQRHCCENGRREEAGLFLYGTPCGFAFLTTFYGQYHETLHRLQRLHTRVSMQSQNESMQFSNLYKYFLLPDLNCQPEVWQAPDIPMCQVTCLRSWTLGNHPQENSMDWGLIIKSIERKELCSEVTSLCLCISHFILLKSFDFSARLKKSCGLSNPSPFKFVLNWLRNF